MRLLILTQYFPPEIGAPQTRLQAMSAELKHMGHEIEVVTAMPNYPRASIYPEYRRRFYCREVRDGIVVHRVWMYAAMGGGIRRLLSYGSFVIMSIFGLLRASRPDYVFVESPPLPLTLPAYAFARLWGASTIMNVADLWPGAAVEMGLLKEGFLARLMRQLESWSYRRATFVNAMTEGIQKYLLLEKGLAPEKILFLPNGVNTMHYRPRPADMALKRQLGLEDKKIILYQGTQGYAHGLDVVLRAAQLLNHRPEIHFLLIGDGSERARLEELRRSTDLRNVTFHDAVSIEELPPYFSIAECGLVSLRDLPFLRGTRPAKMFPILASGKPIIFVGNGEGACLALEARAALVVPPGNPEALAHAVTELLDDPAMAEELGRNGRQFVETNLQWSKLIPEWTAQLSRLPRRAGFAASATRT
jgi:colanic acid biosynthesis glycosyl transferase WcaI